MSQTVVDTCRVRVIRHGGTLTPTDFHLAQLRDTAPRPYPPGAFARTYAWMVSWGLLPADATYERLVDNRIEVVPR